MPILYKVTHDMFQFEDVCDYMCNPVNLVSTPGAGLALEFRKRTPSYVEPYRQACREKTLRMGTVQVIETPEQSYDVICVPTKRHYSDTSDKDDITRSLEAIRELLQQDQYRYATICLPMLGCGLGTQDYPTVLPIMKDTLSDLEATVLISMSPDRTDFRPKYLVIVGPPDYILTEEDKIKVEQVIDVCMLKWGTTLDEYEAIVSGGFPGVDSFVAGSDYLKHVEDTFVFQRTGKTPIVVKPNRVRNGLGSHLIQGNLLCEIADDIILFKPKGYNANRLSSMQMWLEADKLKREADGHTPRRVAVYGEMSMDLVNKPMLISVQRGDD